MTQLNHKVAAVTGAGSGIGRELAIELAKRGAKLALADINARGLEETVALLPSQGGVTTHVVDVASREQVEGYARDVAAKHGGADLIINNAGLAVKASIEAVSYEEFARVIDVNLWGVVYGTKAFLPLLRARGAGHIVNISSINGMVPFVANAPYNVSKYAVLGFSESLMQELRGSSIHVTSVHPGGIRTNIVRNAIHASAGDAKEFDRIAMTSPKQAAQVILRGVEHNTERVYIGMDSKLMAAAKRLFPSTTVKLAGLATAKRTQRP